MKRLTWIVVGTLAGGIVGVNISPDMTIPGLIGGFVLGVLLSGRISRGKGGRFADEDPRYSDYWEDDRDASDENDDEPDDGGDDGGDD